MMTIKLVLIALLFAVTVSATCTTTERQQYTQLSAYIAQYSNNPAYAPIVRAILTSPTWLQLKADCGTK